MGSNTNCKKEPMSEARTKIRTLLADAQNQTAFVSHTPTGYAEPTAYFAKAPASTGILNLANSFLPKIINADGNLYGTPIATDGGERTTISAGILQNSRCAAAGAVIITRPDPVKAHAIGTGLADVAFERVAKFFSTIEAAPFSTVDDDINVQADVQTSDLPINRATIDWSTSIQKSVRFEIPRTLQRLIGHDQIVDEVLVAFVLGLARASDAVLLAAIEATNPATFTTGAAAAKGLRIDELRGLVGTEGTGAGWRGDGAFAVAGGIVADTTADTAGTVIGSFGRAGVAIHESIDLIVERRNTKGDLVLTAHANVIALLPDPSVFWKV